jgi:endonuclease/exonuclease/phosphatase family metal-dependent hydrolase
MSLRKSVILIALVLLTISVNSQTVKFLTYNLRFDNPADGANAWTNRRAWLCEQVKQANPDVFGIQEGLISQIKYLDSVFSDYRHTGVGREDGKTKGEFSALFFNAKKIRILKQSTFWLSPTPQKPTMGWDAACMRICSYGLFQIISTGRKFWVFNTHLDHIGVQARKNSASLILQKIKKLNQPEYPVILMGDFNSTPESEPFKMITEQFSDSKIAEKSMSMGPEGTFNGFEATKPATERIDFIFTSKKGIILQNYFVLRESREARYASDHFPVFIEVKFE